MRSKKELFYLYNELNARQARGGYWIGRVKELINPGQILAEAATIKILLWNYNIPTYLIVLALIFKELAIMVSSYFIGRFDERMGLWKSQNEYLAKKEHLSPFNVEIKGTLVAICKKIGIPHKFKEL